MTHHINTLVLTPLTHRRLLTLKGKKEMRCRRCGKQLQDGDRIVSKIAQGRGYRTKYYHKICWDAMFI